MINGAFFIWEEVTTGAPQGSVLGLVLFKNFINDLDQGKQGMLVKLADNTKLGRIAKILEDRNKIQNDLDRFEHRTENNRMKFNRTKCKVLHLEEKNQMHSYKMGEI